MDPITIAAASGMKARAESLTVLANNLANQGSAGFKADREFYSSYVSADSMPGFARNDSAASPVIEQNWTDFAQGTLLETGRPTDFALRGNGFFTVQGPAGKLLTRNGEFRVSQDGTLQSPSGYAVLDPAGRPIKIDAGREFDVDVRGDIRQEGALVARLGVVELDHREALSKRDGLYFQFAGPEPALRQAEQTEVLQKRIEASNASPAESAVKLITVLRQFEVLQKAIHIGGEMGRRAEEVARVGS